MPWSAALAGPEVAVSAPDLPGHGQAEPSVDGSYTGGLIMLAAARYLAAEDTSDPPVVVGAGASGWVALVLALAGRASAVAVVDGLGGPWRSAADATADGVAWARRLLSEPALSEPVPAGSTDPRLDHLLPPFSNERVVREVLAALRVPLLAVSGPADPLSADEREALLAEAGAPVSTAIARSAGAVDVAPLVSDWMGRIGLQRTTT
jgi:pimeloyl-ACP methyl ester carboxylesterase